MRHQSGVRSAFAVVVAALVLLSGQSVIPSQAAPSPSPSPTPNKLKDAKDQVVELEEQASAIDEDYHEASEALDESKQRLAVLESDIAAQRKKVETLGEQVRAIALMQFRNRDVDTTVQIFTSGDPETLLDRLSTASKVDDDINATLAAHEAEQANLTDMQRTAAAETSALGEQEQKLEALKKLMESKVDAAQALVLQLTAEQRAALEATDAKTGWNPNELDGVSANARALGAIRYATSKVKGGQYVWGSSGPTGFDCSGLMQAAYRSVGISLPHSSRAQANVGRAVSRSELKPGDLIFWYHPIHHVGMYIGNGKIVHARNTRVDLVIQTLSSYPAPWAGARRVVG
jgi:cell wall-associated NlpC family hydrolase